MCFPYVQQHGILADEQRESELLTPTLLTLKFGLKCVFRMESGDTATVENKSSIIQTNCFSC